MGEQLSKAEKKADREREKAAKKQARADRAYVRWFAFLRFAAGVLKVFLPYKRHDETAGYEDRPYVFLCNHYRNFDFCSRWNCHGIYAVWSMGADCAEIDQPVD